MTRRWTRLSDVLSAVASNVESSTAPLSLDDVAVLLPHARVGFIVAVLEHQGRIERVRDGARVVGVRVAGQLALVVSAIDKWQPDEIRIFGEGLIVSKH